MEYSSMFETIASFLGAGTTGTFVSIVCAIQAYCRERKAAEHQATIDGYLEWIRRKDQKELLAGQHDLLTILEVENDNSKIVLDYLQRIMGLVDSSLSIVTDICQHTKRLPSMDEKLNVILEKLDRIESSPMPKGQVAVSAKVLDVLASGVKGAGIRVTMEHKSDTSKVGTLFFLWLLGEKSPHLMLADYVGGIHQNRISLILNPDATLALRVYDGAGHRYELVSSSCAEAEYLAAFAIWKGRELSLCVNNTEYGPVNMSTEFEFLGPPLFFGIDIEGILSADSVRWAPPGEQPGLNYQKDGIWHGSRHDKSMLWERSLDRQEIRSWTEDPYMEFRPRNRDLDKELLACDAAIESNPSDAFMHVRRAKIWCEKGDLETAISGYDEANRLNPELADAYICRSGVWILQGEWGKAMADLDEAIGLRPRSTAAHNGRAWLLATCIDEAFRDGRRALEDAKKACALSCWSSATVDTLAAVFAETGDYPEAVKWQMKAIEHAAVNDTKVYQARLELYKSGKPYRENRGG